MGNPSTGSGDDDGDGLMIRTPPIALLRPARWLAWSLALISVALAVALVILARRNGRTWAEIVTGQEGFSAAYAVAFPLVGAIIAARLPRNPLGWILCGIGMSQGLALYAGNYATLGLVTKPGSLPAASAMAWLGEWVWAPGFALLPFLLLLFPHGHLPSHRWRWLAWTAASAFPLWVLAALSPAAEALGPAAFFAMVGTLLLALAAPIVRFRRAEPEERQQLKWFAYGGLVFTSVLVPTAVFDAPDVLQMLAVPILPGAIAVAILRYRLYEIDRLISRTVSYALLTGLLGAVYAAGVVLLGTLLRPLGADSDLAVAGSTLVVAAVFGPARRRVQAGVDRRFNRARYDAERTVAALRTLLGDEVDLDQLTRELLAAVHATVQPARASLWLRAPGSGR